VHVEQAPRRREAMARSGRRTAGVGRGGEPGPGHGGGVEGVQVVETDWGTVGETTGDGRGGRVRRVSR
jgi:hypothetical protein